MKINARYRTTDILTAGQCSMNFAKPVIFDINCYEAVTSRKGNSRHHYSVYMTEFIQQQQGELLGELNMEVLDLARKMKSHLLPRCPCKGLRYRSYKKCRDKL